MASSLTKSSHTLPSSSVTKLSTFPIKPSKQQYGCASCRVQLGHTVGRCSQCRLVLYCSERCQLFHWQESHSQLCEPYTRYSTLSIPDQQQQPQLVKTEEQQQQQQQPQLEEQFQEQQHQQQQQQQLLLGLLRENLVDPQGQDNSDTESAPPAYERIEHDEEIQSHCSANQASPMSGPPPPFLDAHDGASSPFAKPLAGPSSPHAWPTASIPDELKHQSTSSPSALDGTELVNPARNTETGDVRVVLALDLDHTILHCTLEEPTVEMTKRAAVDAKVDLRAEARMMAQAEAASAHSRVRRKKSKNNNNNQNKSSDNMSKRVAENEEYDPASPSMTFKDEDEHSHWANDSNENNDAEDSDDYDHDMDEDAAIYGLGERIHMGFHRIDLGDNAFKRYGRRFLWVKFRPHINRFIRFLASERHKFVPLVYTHGRRAYAESVVEIIDPYGTVFGGRIISRPDADGENGVSNHGDNKGAITKGLNEVEELLNRLANRDHHEDIDLNYLDMALEQRALIVDDRVDAWDTWSANSIFQVKPFEYFPNGIRAFPQLPKLDSPALNPTGTKPPTTRTDTQLIDLMSALKKVKSHFQRHADLYTKYKARKRASETVKALAAITGIACEEEPKHDDDDGDLEEGELVAVPKSDTLEQLEKSEKYLYDVSQEADIRESLKTIRMETLKGCVILFSSIIPNNFRDGSESFPLWVEAVRAGAKCVDVASEEVTHVVTVRVDTAKVFEMRILNPSCHIVHFNWVLDSIAAWRREPESVYEIYNDELNRVAQAMEALAQSKEEEKSKASKPTPPPETPKNDADDDASKSNASIAVDVDDVDVGVDAGKNAATTNVGGLSNKEFTVLRQAVVEVVRSQGAGPAAAAALQGLRDRFGEVALASAVESIMSMMENGGSSENTAAVAQGSNAIQANPNGSLNRSIGGNFQTSSNMTPTHAENLLHALSAGGVTVTPPQLQDLLQLQQEMNLTDVTGDSMRLLLEQWQRRYSQNGAGEQQTPAVGVHTLTLDQLPVFPPAQPQYQQQQQQQQRQQSQMSNGQSAALQYFTQGQQQQHQPQHQQQRQSPPQLSSGQSAAIQFFTQGQQQVPQQQQQQQPKNQHWNQNGQQQYQQQHHQHQQNNQYAQHQENQPRPSAMNGQMSNSPQLIAANNSGSARPAKRALDGTAPPHKRQRGKRTRPGAKAIANATPLVPRPMSAAQQAFGLSPRPPQFVGQMQQQQQQNGQSPAQSASQQQHPRGPEGYLAPPLAPAARQGKQLKSGAAGAMPLKQAGQQGALNGGRLARGMPRGMGQQPPRAQQQQQQQPRPSGMNMQSSQGQGGMPLRQGSGGMPPRQGQNGMPPRQGQNGMPPRQGPGGMPRAMPPRQGQNGMPPRQGSSGMPPRQGPGGMPPRQAPGGMPPRQGQGGMPPNQGPGGMPPGQGQNGMPPRQGVGGMPPRQGQFGQRFGGMPPQMGPGGMPPRQGSVGQGFFFGGAGSGGGGQQGSFAGGMPRGVPRGMPRGVLPRGFPPRGNGNNSWSQ